MKGFVSPWHLQILSSTKGQNGSWEINLIFFFFFLKSYPLVEIEEVVINCSKE